jgi:hypothetical protein
MKLIRDFPEMVFGRLQEQHRKQREERLMIAEQFHFPMASSTLVPLY